MKKKRNREEQKRLLVRVLAIVLAVLLVGGTIASVVISMAEETQPARDQVEMEITFQEDEQALRVTQRLLYTNRTDGRMDRVLFSASANLYRRESALPYDNEDLLKAFPSGYAPGGIELISVHVDGEAAEYGFQGENETVLRVACALDPGESCLFAFEYYVLLTENSSLLGAGKTDVRLSGFFLMPGVPNDGGFVTRDMNSFTRWAETTPSDYSVRLTLPKKYLASGTGTQSVEAVDGLNVWTFRADNARDFVLSFGKRWRERSERSGDVNVRVLTNLRGRADAALSIARASLGLAEEWFGAFPVDEIEIVQSDYPVCARSFPGVLWVDAETLKDDARLRQAIRFFLAQQYIGYAAWTEPVAHAWLSDVPCAYLALMMTEMLDGRDAFLQALNALVLDSLNITVPGNLTVTMSAETLTREEYELITIGRGTVVMHETRVAMGSEAFLQGMRLFYETGLRKDVLEETDLPLAFDKATGGDWEAFLTNWLFGVDDYLEQGVEWYE